MVGLIILALITIISMIVFAGLFGFYCENSKLLSERKRKITLSLLDKMSFTIILLLVINILSGITAGIIELIKLSNRY